MIFSERLEILIYPSGSRVERDEKFLEAAISRFQKYLDQKEVPHSVETWRKKRDLTRGEIVDGKVYRME